MALDESQECPTCGLAQWRCDLDGCGAPPALVEWGNEPTREVPPLTEDRVLEQFRKRGLL